MKQSLLFTTFLCCTAGAAAADGWLGSVEGGLFDSFRDSTQNDLISDSFLGGYVSGYAGRDFGQLAFSVDGRVEYIDAQGATDAHDSGPRMAGVLGLHLGYTFGNGYAGAFVGRGLFDGYDESGEMTGKIGGLEVAYAVNPRIDLSGQFGWAEIIGDPGDNEYKGYVVHLQADMKVNDQWKVSLGLDNGRSENCFVDCPDQPGEFWGSTFGAEYALNDKLTLVGSLNYLRVHDYNDTDTGIDTSLYFGARYNFGDKSDRRRIITPVQVFRAAGYQWSLD
jgi:hypothetical protein